MDISTMEIIEELKKQIGELYQTNAMLTITCKKLQEKLNDCECQENIEE